MKSYWYNRYSEEELSLLTESIYITSRKIESVYLKTAKNLVDKLVSLYAKIVEYGGTSGVTRGTIYQYNRYYSMLEEVLQQLQKMGIKIEEIMLNSLKDMYIDSSLYTGAILERQGIHSSFNRVDERAIQAARSIWCTDGKTWSDRVWGNINALKDKLSEAIPTAIATGQGAVQLELELVNDFNVSWNRAKSLVVTELSHTYNEAALDRMYAADIKKVKWYASQIEKKMCEECKNLDGKEFTLPAARGMIPKHPNCMCTWLAIIDNI